jgi:hypothetical protein
LEDLVKQLAQSNMQFQQRTETNLQNMQTQIGQLASSLSQLQSQGSGQMPSQTIPNPKGNLSVVTLRNGKQVIEPTTKHENLNQRGEMENTTAIVKEHNKELQKDVDQAESSTKQTETEMKIPLPFPHRKTQSKKAAEAEMDKEIMETFQKVEVNIPLLDAIKQIPKYAKFLKEFCTHKRKLKGVKSEHGKECFYNNSTQLAHKMQRSRYFHNSLHHRRKAIYKCHVRFGSFYKCHAKVNLQFFEHWRAQAY